MQLPVTYETLGSLDSGAAKAIINAAIKEAVSDLDDRGGDDGKARTVLIQIVLTPRSNGQAEVEVQATAKLPPRRTASTVAALRFAKDGGGSQLLFQDLAPDDPDQKTIDEVIDKQKHKKKED